MPVFQFLFFLHIGKILKCILITLPLIYSKVSELRKGKQLGKIIIIKYYY